MHNSHASLGDANYSPPTLDISAFLGQEITLELELTEVPYYMVFPAKTRVVHDPSGLRTSTLPSEPGMRLKADDGTVARILCLPIDNTYDSIDIYGQSYSRK